jgi:polar amino acid transport system substrate-binding protein
LARHLDLPVEFTRFYGAGSVVDAGKNGVWDLAFLAVDPARMDTVSFSKPYVLIESTFAVRNGGPVTTVDDTDRPGRSILVGHGSAYDLYLTKHLKHATLIRAENPGASFQQFLEGEADCVAGVRQSLEAAFGSNPDITIFAESIATIEQAMAVPATKGAVIEHVNAFLDAAIADGTVRSALDASGKANLMVAPRR